MVKTLKLWNGRDIENIRDGHLYIAAYSKTDACRMLTELYPRFNEGQWNREMTIYFSNCWGYNMNTVKPERGIWKTITSIRGGFTTESLPVRVYPFLRQAKCECKIVPELHSRDCQCEEGCPSEEPSIEYCALHSTAQDLFDVLKNIMENGPDPDFDYSALVAKAEGR